MLVQPRTPACSAAGSPPRSEPRGPKRHSGGHAVGDAVPLKIAFETSARRGRTSRPKIVSADRPENASAATARKPGTFWPLETEIAERYQLLNSWRRGRDSNPRYGFPYTHFPGVRLRPLGHPSATRVLARSARISPRAARAQVGATRRRPGFGGVDSARGFA